MEVTSDPAARPVTPECRVQITEKEKKMALRAFMSKLNRTLKTKTGQPQGRLALKIHGVVRPLFAKHPSDLKTLSVDIDKLPRGKSPQWYLAMARAIVADYQQRHRETEARMRPRASQVLYEEAAPGLWVPRKRREGASIGHLLREMVRMHHKVDATEGDAD